LKPAVGHRTAGGGDDDIYRARILGVVTTNNLTCPCWLEIVPASVPSHRANAGKILPAIVTLFRGGRPTLV